MLKFNRKHKKLVIPVGINPSYNIDSDTLYNTSDATATANDIISGKVSYSGDGKVIGTLDIDDLIEESYNEGVNEQKSKLTTITITENGSYSREDGYNEVIVEVPDLNGNYDEGYNDGVNEQKSKLTTITITENGTYNREDGYNEVIVDVPDLNGNYDEGYNDGVAVGREEIINEQSDATITPQTVFKGEIGYGKDNERIVGEFEFVEGFDFGKIGYSQELSKELNRDTAEKLAYSKSLYDAWDPNRTSAKYYFQNDSSLVYAPNVNCSNIASCDSMFSGCRNLTTVPALNSTKCKNFNNMFKSCSNLTNVGLIDTSSALSMDDMFSDCLSLTTVPLFNTSNVTDMRRMFYTCSSLTTVPLFNTSNVTDISYMFAFCSNLTGAAPNFNLSSATNVRNMFMICSKLTSIPQYDLSNVVTLGPFLYNCSGLTSIPNFNTSKATNYSETFNGCIGVVTIGTLDMSSATEVYNTFENCVKLENIAGVTNCGKGFTGTSSSYHTLSFSSSSKLTKQSCLNIFNTIYDMTQTSVTDAKITLHATTKALLSPEDIAIATSKGWTIS